MSANTFNILKITQTVSHNPTHSLAPSVSDPAPKHLFSQLFTVIALAKISLWITACVYISELQCLIFYTNPMKLCVYSTQSLLEKEKWHTMFSCCTWLKTAPTFESSLQSSVSPTNQIKVKMGLGRKLFVYNLATRLLYKRK